MLPPAVMLPARVPQISAPSSATSAKPNKIPKVPTTFSFATNPVIAATADLPVAPAKRCKNPCDAVSDGGKNTVVKFHVGQHSELSVDPSEVSCKPHNNG